MPAGIIFKETNTFLADGTTLYGPKALPNAVNGYGYDVQLAAQDAVAGFTNADGGSLILNSGATTGLGTSQIFMRVPGLPQITGSSVNPPINAIIISPGGRTLVNGPLTANGGFAGKHIIIRGNYTVIPTDYVIIPLTTSQTSTITLPDSQNFGGRWLYIWDALGNAGTNNITISTTGGQTIRSAATGATASFSISTNFGGVALFGFKVGDVGTGWFVAEAPGGAAPGVAQPANQIVYGNAGGTGVTSNAGFAWNNTTQTLGFGPGGTGNVTLLANIATTGASRNLILQAGAPPTTATDTTGGSAIVSGGISNGSQGSLIAFRVASSGGASGTTQVTPADRMRLDAGGRLLISDFVGVPSAVARLHVYENSSGNDVARFEYVASSNDRPLLRLKPRKAATNNATPTVLETIATTTDNVIRVEAWVTARRTGGSAGTAGDVASYRLFATFKNIAGVVTQVSTTVKDAQEDQAGWDADFAVSGTNLQILVTGAVNNNVTWESFSWIMAIGS